MTTILTSNFTGDRRTIPGTVSGWSYELTIQAAGNEYLITVNEIPGNPANARAKKNECYMDATGVFRWKSNDSIISPDICVETFVARIPAFNAELQAREYALNMAIFITQYRAAEATRKVTMEERYEMTAAFGFDKTVVNVLSGRKTRTLSRKQVR
jgi:hypothetical protein